MYDVIISGVSLSWICLDDNVGRIIEKTYFSYFLKMLVYRHYLINNWRKCRVRQNFRTTTQNTGNDDVIQTWRILFHITNFINCKLQNIRDIILLPRVIHFMGSYYGVHHINSFINVKHHGFLDKNIVLLFLISGKWVIFALNIFLQTNY